MKKLSRIKLLLCIVSTVMLIGAASAADLINTSFEAAEGWGTHAYSTAADWTDTGSGQTWQGVRAPTGNETPGVYASTPTHTGSAKCQFRAIGAQLISDAVVNPGELTFWAAKSSGDNTHTMVVQTGTSTSGPWTDRLTYTNNATDMPASNTYYEKTVTLNLSGTYYLRFIMTARSSATAYLDDIVLTEYVPPDDPDATVDPGSILYGPINQGGYLNVPVEITADPANSGNITINSPGFTITGPDAAKFGSAGSGFPKTLTPGTTDTLYLSYSPGSVNHADHYATATLICNDPHPPIVLLHGKTFWDVPDIAKAREATPTSGTLRITGTVTATVATSGLTNSPDRFQFYVQDSSGLDGQSAIMIDDPSNVMGYYFVIGQQCFNLKLTAAPYHNMLEFTPAVSPAMVLGATVAPPAPLVLTGAVTDFETVEAELVRINSADVAETGSWAANTNYALTAPGGLVISTIRVEEASQVVGDTIPAGTMDVIGIAVQYDSDYQIEPRLHTDVINTKVADWSLYR